MRKWLSTYTAVKLSSSQTEFFLRLTAAHSSLTEYAINTPIQTSAACALYVFYARVK